MTVKVAVAGASGYAGGEVLRLVAGHPEVEIGALTAGSNAGTRLGEHQPHLQPLADRVLADTTTDVLADHDVVFLALPHGHSAAISAELGDAAIVIDLAADHRLTSADAWQKWYGSDAAEPWPYGLPELLLATGDKQRENLKTARRIAVPGCHPTGATLALAPALKAELAEPDVTITNITGTSGAGKSLKPHLLGAEVMGSLSPYGVGGAHRHTPEFMQNLAAASGHDVTVSFTPVLAPLPRGILTTATAPIVPGVDAVTVRAAYDKAYADEPFVHLLPEGTWPTTAATLGSNNALLQVTVDELARKLVVVAAIDNLTKGTAGAAVQCMNLAVGLDETIGLPTAGVAP